MTAVYFTDSCSDLPVGYAEKRGLMVLPMVYRLDDTDYVDDGGVSFSMHDFYEALRAGKMSSTSQLSAHSYETAFSPILEKGQDVVYLCFSSALSGTYQSACLAARNLSERFPDSKVYVIDSLCASLGQGLLCHLMLNMRDEGLSTQQVVDWVEQNKGRVCHWFTVADLNHLHRGGRLSFAAAFLGTLLNIKPVLHVDPQGRLVPVERVKGRAKSILSLLSHMRESAGKNDIVFISHGDCEADALKLRDRIREETGIENFVIGTIGPIVGSHSGPDTLSLFFLGAPR